MILESIMPFHYNISDLDGGSSSRSTNSGGPSDLIDDRILYYLELYLLGVATTLLSGFGMISNIINFVVFMKQKSSDCVSICLKSLTVTDLCAMSSTFSSCLSAIVKIRSSGLTVDPEAVLYVTQWGRGVCFDISMATTAFIAVERCLCVVMPFHFKNVITVNVALSSLVAIYVFTIGSYLPILLTHGFTSQFDVRYNKTRYVLWLSSNRVEIEKISNIYTHIIVATIFQIIVIVSTYAMIVGLRRSSKFRRAMASSAGDTSSKQTSQPIEINSVSRLTETAQGDQLSACTPVSHIKSTVTETKIEVVTSLNRKASVKKEVLSDKNKAVSKMVSILTSIFIVCNFFRLALIYGRRIWPELGPQALKNSYFAVLDIWIFIGAFNCSVNCFVYYFLSPSYKTIFQKTFCQCIHPKSSA